MWLDVARLHREQPFEAGCATEPRRYDYNLVPDAVLAEAVAAVRPDPLPFLRPPPHSTGEARLPADPVAREAFAKALLKDVISGGVTVTRVGLVPTVVDCLPVFCIEQAGKWRMIHDARLVNLYLPGSSALFEYVTDMSLYPDATFATKLDLQSAYRQVRVHRDDRRRLGFRVGQWIFQYATLPFGLSCAPARFLAAVRPAVAQARAEGVSVIWYMDDLLILGDSCDELARSVRRVVDLLARSGLRVAPDKFWPVAATRLEFLGHLVDLQRGVITVTAARLQRIHADAADMLTAPSVSVAALQSLLGRVAFAVSLGGAVLRPRALFAAVSIARATGVSRTVLCPLAREELAAMVALSADDVVYEYRREAAHRRSPPIALVGDANEASWACVVADDPTGRLGAAPPHDAVTGRWSDDELADPLSSSAAREIEAITRAVERLDVRNAYITYTSDAQAALAAIRSGGRAAGTATATVRLARVLRERRVTLDVFWCGRDEGLLPLADALARAVAGAGGPRLSSPEWRLAPGAFAAAVAALGGPPPTVDLFARPGNAQIARFCSQVPWLDDSVGSGHTLPLVTECPWVFPPWSQARRAVRRLAAERPPAAYLVLRPIAADGGYVYLSAAEAAGRLHVAAAVRLPHTSLQSCATGQPAARELWPLLCVLVRPGRGTGQPLWWTRERLVCVEWNPGPGGAADSGAAGDDWASAPLRRPPDEATVPTVAAAWRALAQPGSALALVATDPSVAAAVSPEVLRTLAAVHATWTPPSTGRAHESAAAAFAAFVRRNAVPTACWTDEVACVLLAGWAEAEALRQVKASTIRTYVYAARAVLRLWGAPVRDDAKVLQSIMYRLGGQSRAVASAKQPFTVGDLQAIQAYLSRTGQLADPRVFKLFTGCVLAFALVQRGEVVRRLEPRHVAVKDDAVVLRYDGTSKCDPAFQAAAPRGHTTGTAMAMAVRWLGAWLRLLPPGWTGPLFPVLKPARGAGLGPLVQDGAVCCHLGTVWYADPTPREQWNAAIASWEQACGLPGHRTFHCLRVGGAQHLLRVCGGDIRVLKAAGGWKSDAVFLYVAVAIEEAIAASRGEPPAARAAPRAPPAAGPRPPT